MQSNTTLMYIINLLKLTHILPLTFHLFTVWPCLILIMILILLCFLICWVVALKKLNNNFGCMLLDMFVEVYLSSESLYASVTNEFLPGMDSCVCC